MTEVSITPVLTGIPRPVGSRNTWSNGGEAGGKSKGLLNLLRISQALSLLEGRDFVLPETVQSLAPGVIGHRLVLEADAQYAGRTGQTEILEIIEELAVPV